VATIRTLGEGAQLAVRDIACCAPRGGPGATRGGEGTHLVFVRRGAFVAHLGSRAYVADPCTAVVSWADTEYRIAHPGAHGDDCTVLELAPGLADELLHGRRARRDVEVPLAPGAQLRCARLLAAPSEAVEDLALELAGEALGGTVVGPPQRRRAVVRRVRELLDADPSVARSAAELAAAVGVSPHHLMRVFRSETGTTLRAYRIRLRLALALHRLREGERDLSALAADLGFASHAHLTDTFARCLGTSPRDIRSAITARGVRGSRSGTRPRPS
jgi:AraC family transcriptional regulator